MSVFIHLLNIFKMISRYQILTHNDWLNKSSIFKFIALFLQFCFYPIGIFKAPKEKFSDRLTNCLQHLGPIYIKLGQTLSTRPDLCGILVAKQLQSLQDRLPPFSSAEARQIIETELERSIDELFDNFDDESIAAASISQVHKATLKTGEIVAVKILRPNIYEIYNRDIALLDFVAKFLPKIYKKFKRLKAKEVIQLFHKTMVLELNLRLEAAAASEMAANFARDRAVYIPKIYWSMTTEKIMIMEWVDGVSLYDRHGLALINLDPKIVAQNIAVTFFNQAYRDGFFHADLHPGNIFIRRDGCLVLVDFGIMGRLEEVDRLAIAEILFSFLKKDYLNVAKIHLRAGYVPTNTDLPLFAQYCRSVAEPIMGLEVKEISIGKLLAQLFKITEKFGMETQPQLLLLQKTMVVVEGVGRSLDPNINMWQLAEPWMEKWAAKNITPEAKLLRLTKKMISQLLEKIE